MSLFAAPASAGDIAGRIFGFKPHLRCHTIDGAGVFVVGERERYLLKGDLHLRVAPLLNGTRTIAQVADELEGEVSLVEILYAVEELQARGLIADVPVEREATGAYWQALGIQPDAAHANLAAAIVSVEAVEGCDSAPVIAALMAAGVRIGPDGGLRLRVVDDYLSLDLQRLQLLGARDRVAWLPFRPGGLQSWMGPVFRPGSTPCWECLAHRLRGNRPVETYISRRLEPLSASPIAVRSPAGANLAASLLAAAVADWIARGGRNSLDGHLWTIDHATLATSKHVVVSRPQCPACGDAGLMRTRASRPVALASCRKTYTADGGHRSVTPEATCERLQHHISPITGIISSLGPVRGRDHALAHVYATSWFVCPIDDRPGFEDFHRTSMGKGRTIEQARASAICESIERYSAVHQGDEPVVRASLHELGALAVHPHDLQNFSERQYRRRDELNAAMPRERGAVPRPYDGERPLDWTPVWSLTRGSRRFVPSAYCYVNLPVPPDERFCYHNPSGHAAGNSLEEAILQGFFELVERDAVALWWYNRLLRPAVDFESLGEPYFAALVEYYSSLGWTLWFLDVTSDLAIPTSVAVARHTTSGRYCVGFGTHFDPRLSVMRAATELAQIFDARQEMPPPWDAGALADTGYLCPDPCAVPRRSDSYPERSHDDLEEDVEACVAIAERAGLETLVLDLTRPDIGVPAVKVIVPGLRHFWPRLGPGRLYDVPYRLGWVDGPRREEDMNQVPLLL